MDPGIFGIIEVYTILKKCVVFFHQKGLRLELYLHCMCNAVLELNKLSLLPNSALVLAALYPRIS